MLEELRITSLGVIDAATLEFGPGLTVITGETGAGKTMIVTALGLLLGGRGDAGAVRTGAAKARVEGVMSTRSTPDVETLVAEAGGEVEDQTLVLSRTVAAEGRSRAHAGGSAVPVSTLGAIADHVVAIHGQSDQHRLLQARTQRDALDRFAGPNLAALASTYGASYARLVDVEREAAEVGAALRERAREADLLRFGVGEIDAVNPVIGEDRDLAAEEARLGAVDALQVASETARMALAGGDDPNDTRSAMSSLAAARAAMDAVREDDADAAALANRLGEVGYLVADLAADVAAYATGIEADPGRLAAVSARRSALTALLRKYGESVDEVIAWRDSAVARLADLDGTDQHLEDLSAERAALRRDLAAQARALSDARSAAARELEREVTEELTHLAMPHARLTVDVRQVISDPASGRAPLEVGDRQLRFGPGGVDEVEFLLAPNPGADPRPLDRGASGGELSRVMLALEVVLSMTSPVPTFVFDEVDAGVGGAAAVEIGRRLARLAKVAQVLVVTHLPQVASFGDQHVVVEKSSDGLVTSSSVVTLDETGRERELSRMLAGMSDSESGLAHARELLATARTTR